MKVSLEAKLKTPKGEVMKDNDNGKVVDLTLRRAINAVLGAPLESDRELGWKKLFDMGNLMKAVEEHKKGEFDISSEDVTMLKERCSKLFPNIVWALVKCLEG